MSYDVVAVFDNSLNQLFVAARAMKFSAKPSSRIMDHPIESGAVISDFQIKLPIEGTLSVICTGDDYWNVYQEILAVYESQNTVIVTTNVDAYFNMLIQAIPHDEHPEMFDVVAVEIKLREVLLVDTLYQALPPKKVFSPNDQSTVNSGSTSGQTTSSQNKSAIASAVDSLKK